eukprot:g23162.t1
MIDISGFFPKKPIRCKETNIQFPDILDAIGSPFRDQERRAGIQHALDTGEADPHGFHWEYMPQPKWPGP